MKNERSMDKRAIAAAVRASCGFMAGVLAWAGMANAQASPSAYTSATRYDSVSRVVGTIAPDPDGTGPLTYAAMRNTYNAMGFLERIEKGSLFSWQPEATLPENWSGFTVTQTVVFVYDITGRKLSQRTKDSAGNTATLVQFSYDADGRLECTAQRMNSGAFGSPPSNACTLGASGSQGPDRITKTIYDAAGQVAQTRKAVGVTTGNGFPATLEQAYATYAYWPNGQVSYIVDAKGNKMRLNYDGFDRRSEWVFAAKVGPPLTGPGAFDPSTPATALASAAWESSTDYEAYGYDANGNRTSLKKRSGQTITYSYDNLNRMSHKGGAVAGVDYSYDVRGLQLTAKYSAGGEGITNGYDGFGRISSESTSMGGVTRTLTYFYDSDGNRKRITFPVDGNYWEFDYDGLDRQTGIRQSGVTPVAGFTYDARGYPNGIDYSNGGAVGVSYYHDDLGRRTCITDNLLGGGNPVCGVSATGADQATSFTRNPASQIASVSRANDIYAWTQHYNVSRNYASNGLNQYNQIASSVTLVPTYDDNGNLTSDGSTTYAYDLENRLISASGAKNATLGYDPLGRLFQVTGNGSTTRFLYSGDELVAEYNTAGGMLRRYVHGRGTDDPLFWYEGAGINPADRRMLFADHQGSITAVADASGMMMSANSYDQWGIPASTNLGRFAYTGQIWLPELGMYHYKARIYSPTLGRFLQTDPIGYNDQINLYAYVGNDPINKVDATGTESGSVAYRSIVQLTIAAEDRGRNGQSGARQIAGAVRDFNRNYNEMVKVNTIGVDKFYHCRANCEASTRGEAGKTVAETISEGREVTDLVRKGTSERQVADGQADRRANETGRSAGESERRSSSSPVSTDDARRACTAACLPLAPSSFTPPPSPPPVKPEIGL